MAEIKDNGVHNLGVEGEKTPLFNKVPVGEALLGKIVLAKDFFQTVKESLFFFVTGRLPKFPSSGHSGSGY